LAEGLARRFTGNGGCRCARPPCTPGAAHERSARQQQENCTCIITGSKG